MPVPRELQAPFPPSITGQGEPGLFRLCDGPAGKQPHSGQVWVALGAIENLCAQL